LLECVAFDPCYWRVVSPTAGEGTQRIGAAQLADQIAAIHHREAAKRLVDEKVSGADDVDIGVDRRHRVAHIGVHMAAPVAIIAGVERRLQTVALGENTDQKPSPSSTGAPEMRRSSRMFIARLISMSGSA
jgi:hypothetical protein